MGIISHGIFLRGEVWTDLLNLLPLQPHHDTSEKTDQMHKELNQFDSAPFRFMMKTIALVPHGSIV